jgi:hypothetical protein
MDRYLNGNSIRISFGEEILPDIACWETDNSTTVVLTLVTHSRTLYCFTFPHPSVRPCLILVKISRFVLNMNRSSKSSQGIYVPYLATI